MKLVIALGGNALLQRGQPLEAALLQSNVNKAAAFLAPLIKTHTVLLVHGNGPQVGLLALQAQAYAEVTPYPFDILDAESQGQIGYLLQQALGNHLSERAVVTVLTQVIVAQEDSAFQNPTKPIGPMYTAQQVEKLSQHYPHWRFRVDGQYLRRVVASPQPQQIVEISAIRTLMSGGYAVIAGGGGGIPCVGDMAQQLTGIEAVIDKDFTAALLAEQLSADRLIILTDVDAVYRDWGNAQATPIFNTSMDELSALSLPAGSMQPKVMAACQFVRRTGKRACIGHLAQVEALLAGAVGTQITESDQS